MNIYVLRGREQQGPFTLEEINDQLSRGELTVSTLAWFEGSPEWVALGTVSGVTGLEEPSFHVPSAGKVPRLRIVTSRDNTGVPGSQPQGGSNQASTDAVDPQQRFYGQVVQAFQLATIHLIEPFEQLDDVVRARKALDPTAFFRLFLIHAAKFNDDCSAAFATLLRQSTRVDAVRGTTVKQLAREIRVEAFEECDATLERYHQTVSCLMGSAEAVIEQANSMGAPIGPTGGALLGSLVAGRGSRGAGAAVGGLSALASAMSTFNRQLELHGQALALIEQAERAAPAQVAEYLDAVAKMPVALVDLLGAKCFGGAMDMGAQQQCIHICVEHIRRLNAEAAESVRGMYQHLEQLAAEESRVAARLQQEHTAKIQREKRTVLAVFIIAILAFIIIIAIHTDTTFQENDAAHKEFERSTAAWLLANPGKTPALPERGVFDGDGYTFHRNTNGRIELWRYGQPVAHENGK